MMNCRIKQLVWHERERLKGQYWAEGIFVFPYEVFQKNGDKRWCVLGTDMMAVYRSALDEAKAVAQAHYEQEVMKHLTTDKPDKE